MELGVIIVAAGSSKRMGFDKLMHQLAGTTVLNHTISQFLNLDIVAEIVVVCQPSHRDSLPKHAKLKHVLGGAERHLSVKAGLDALSANTPYIAVHDGARPLIKDTQIRNVLEVAKQHQAAASAHPITNTVKRANLDNLITESVSREHLWAMETPQIFAANLLNDAYLKLLNEGGIVTDEVSALEAIGIATKLVKNPSNNLKITFPEDIQLAEYLLKLTSSPLN